MQPRAEAPHPKQLHHELSVLFILVFVLLLDLLQFVLWCGRDEQASLTSPP